MNNISNRKLKILNFFREADDSKFMGRKWFTINDQSKAIYDPGNGIIYYTSFKI